MILRGSKTALGAGLTASFFASGGTAPYVYSLVPLGAGGSINSSTGLYTAPVILNPNPKFSSETVRVRDANNVIAEATLLVTDVLGLFCEIVQRELELDDGRVYLWDQKINQPKDSGLYIAVAELSPKPFGNTNRQAAGGGGLNSEQSVNMRSLLQVSLISRGPEARTRKEELLMSLASNYSISQQEANSFSIGRLPAGGQFVNLSSVDGAAIPYRYDITVSIQYFVRRVRPVTYISDFETVEITTEP